MNCWCRCSRQILPDQPGADVGRAAGRIADQPAHGMVRIIVGRARRSRAGNAGTNQGDGQPNAAFHAGISFSLHAASMAAWCVQANYAASAMPHKCIARARRSLEAVPCRQRPRLDSFTAFPAEHKDIVMIDLYALTSPNVQKIYIMLEETKLPYKEHFVDVWKGDQYDPDFVKINPNSKIPAIVDHEGPGGKPYHGFRIRRDPDVSRREDRPVHAEGPGEEIRRAAMAVVPDHPASARCSASSPISRCSRRRTRITPTR